MKTQIKLSIITFVALIFIPILAKAQVAVAPPVLFIDAQSRSGSIMVLNQGKEPKEVEVSLKFGYFAGDSSGKSSLIYDDSVADKKYSIAPYTSVFPKKFILQPGDQQSVKFLIKNTSHLADGEYWTRIVTSSKEVKQQIDSTNVGDSVRVGISLRINFVSALFFQKGKLYNTVDMNYKKVTTDSSNVNIIFDFAKDGNAPFFGTAQLAFFNAKDDEVEKISERIPIYFNTIRRFSVSKSKLTPGDYRVEATLSNEQPDVPTENKVKFEKVKKTFTFKVPEN